MSEKEEKCESCGERVEADVAGFSKENYNGHVWCRGCMNRWSSQC